MKTERTRGWWIQRALSALTRYCQADEAARETRAVLSEWGWCTEHPKASDYAAVDCEHCSRARELLLDKVSALRVRASRKATLLAVAKRAGLTTAVPIPRKTQSQRVAESFAESG